MHLFKNSPQPVPISGADQASTEQMYVIEQHNGGRLLLTPYVDASSSSNSNSAGGNSVTSQSHSVDQDGLRHILTAISEQQQGSAVIIN